METRRYYRAEPGPEAGLNVELVDPQGGAHPVAVQDMSAQGLRLGTSEPLPAGVNLGSILTVRFQSTELAAPIDALASVVHVETEDGVTCLGLQFLDWMGLLAMVPPTLAPLFNRRQDPRLTLDAATPVEVLVRGPGDAYEVRGVLLDVSRRGLSFSASLLSQCAMKRSDLCYVEFMLPGCDRRFSFGCRICSRALFGESLRYGVLLDRDHSSSFALQQAALDGHVKTRLDAVLRELIG